MKIFENGYLKSEYINPNYRGLVGWPCEKHIGCNDLWYSNQDTVLVHVDCGYGAYYKNNIYPTLFSCYSETWRIPQFTPEQIPEGELCWMKASAGDIPFESDWKLVVFQGLKNVCADNGEYSRSLAMNDGCGYDVFVPYLIALTAERAEELKDWHKGKR